MTSAPTDYLDRTSPDWPDEPPAPGYGDGEPIEDLHIIDMATMFRNGLLSGRSLLDLPPPEPMIGDWLDRGMLASMPGKFGSLKSFALVYLGLSVASGKPWFGQPIRHTGTVLYVAAEGAYTMPDRIKGWCRHTGASLPERFLVHPHRLDLLDDTGRDVLLNVVREIRPVLIVLDTLSKTMSGDENSKEAMAKVYNALDDLREASGGATIIVAHHTGHGVAGRGRGSSSFEDDIDVVIALHGQAKDGAVKVVSEKQKARRDPAPFWIKLTQIDDGLPLVEVTAAPPIDGDDTTAETKALILARVAEYPGQLTRRDFESKESKGWIEKPQKKVREAVGLLKSEGRICYVSGRREGDRQNQDLVILPEAQK